MSRIGKMPIPIPAGVSVQLGADRVEVRGPRGQLSHPILPKTRLSMEGGAVVVTREDDSKDARAQHGSMRARLANLITGVTAGYEKRLEVQGVGYTVEAAGPMLKMRLGFSHPVEFALPEGISAKVERNVVMLTGIDNQLLGETAARIRRIRPPEHYKGKGIRYAGERVRIKEGKKNA
ncbi:50S ribosomal protein L6 [bacterium]|nr:50S ribosomal protein L6 [bacterium]